jgi:hypothetical protein
MDRASVSAIRAGDGRTGGTLEVPAGGGGGSFGGQRAEATAVTNVSSDSQMVTPAKCSYSASPPEDSPES